MNIQNKKNRFLVLFSVAILTITSHYFCSEPAAQPSPETGPIEKKLSEQELLAKGKYNTLMGGCNDCHSPKIMTPMGPVPDTTRLLSGHTAGSPLPAISYDATKPGNWLLLSSDLTAAVGPWGISYAANLTPDSTTGIGAWTADVFIKTLRTGKHLGQEGGRMILPPMPWPSIAQLTDEDLQLMFAYLQSIPPIKNQVPAPVPPTEVMKKSK